MCFLCAHSLSILAVQWKAMDNTITHLDFTLNYTSIKPCCTDKLSSAKSVYAAFIVSEERKRFIGYYNESCDHILYIYPPYLCL